MRMGRARKERILKPAESRLKRLPTLVFIRGRLLTIRSRSLLNFPDSTRRSAYPVRSFLFYEADCHAPGNSLSRLPHIRCHVERS
jgi:hypothetical protein